MEIVHDFQHTIHGIAIDAEDNIFVANWTNNSIDKVSLNNGKVSITQSINISSSPLGLSINSKNGLYIGTNNAEIMKMIKEGIISNIAGNGTLGFADGIGKNAKIGIVTGICFDENDIAYFCDYLYHSHSAIRKLTLEGKITTICGGERGYSDGKGNQAKFNAPRGIVYNRLSKIFYITDNNNNLIRTMTVDGNVNTLCKYSDNPWAIAIDGEGKLYVSTIKNTSGREGELITVDSKGEIKRMNISVIGCNGMAFNSKGDLFFNSDNKLCVIRNCTKYPPHPILTPTTNVNIKEPQSDIQELKKQLTSTQSQLASTQNEKQKLESSLKKLEIQNKSLEIKLQELERKLDEKEIKEQTGDEVLKWLTSIKLANLFQILQDIGAKDLEFLKLLEESDFEGLNIKALEKRMLFQSLKKLKEDSAIKGNEREFNDFVVFQNNVNL